MKWTVVWANQALAQLTSLWLDAPDRTEITKASSQIDVLLCNRPLEVGEERTPPERVLFIKPLALLYDVVEEDCLVTVYAVWRW